MQSKKENMTNKEMLDSLNDSVAWLILRMDKKSNLHLHSPNPAEGIGLISQWLINDDQAWDMVKGYVDSERKKLNKNRR